MSHDLHLTQEEYGIGAGLFFVGYTFCQVPSQLVLQHVGAPRWLGVIVTTWGVVACCMAAIRNQASFYVVRLILGAAEAGSFPGYWFYLTKFYPDNHIALPYSITDSAIMVSQVLPFLQPRVRVP
jgi:MFS family permease